MAERVRTMESVLRQKMRNEMDLELVALQNEADKEKEKIERHFADMRYDEAQAMKATLQNEYDIMRDNDKKLIKKQIKEAKEVLKLESEEAKITNDRDMQKIKAE